LLILDLYQNWNSALDVAQILKGLITLVGLAVNLEFTVSNLDEKAL